MAPSTLAIDFGTSRTKVAFYDEASGRAQLVEIGREIRTVLPSVFYIPKEGQGERLVGDDAQDMVDSDPEGIVLSLKKELHKLGKKRCGPERAAVDRIHLASDLFSHIRQRCLTEVFHNETISCCRLTVPVDFKAQQREAIRDAAKMGGFEEITLIEEPIAAAQHWLLNQSQEKFGDSVVICDVGGGTTDFAFLRYAGGHFEADEQVLSAGFPLGGNDLDESIWEQFCEIDQAMVQNQDQVAGFLIKIRREREWMTKTRIPKIRLTVGGRQCLFPRTLIEAATSEFVERVKAEAQRFLDNIDNQTKITNAPILLVGGASRLPGLHEALQALQRGKVFLWNDCDYATVLGAVDIPAAPSAKHRPEGEDQTADAQNSLGYKYYQGVGVKQDFGRALVCFQKAADQGNAAAQHNIATMYLNGDGVAKDFSKALNWFQKAADQGNPDAQFGIGWVYENGQGVDRNTNIAVEWYQKAAAQGQSNAQAALKQLAEGATDHTSEDIIRSSPARPIQEVHEVECPSCGEAEPVNDGAGTYHCDQCGEEIKLSLACPKCGQGLKMKKWGVAKCAKCGASFNTWDEAKLDWREVECPSCGETEPVNDGTGTYFCDQCGEEIELSLACPNCGQGLKVNKWGKVKCAKCGTSFDSWDEAKVTTPDEEDDEEEPQNTDHRTSPKKTTKRKPNAAFLKPVTPDDKLAAIVGSKPLPRTEIVTKLWDYIVKNGLQDKKVRTQINADDTLKAIFDGRKSVTMFEMNRYVSGHLKE